MSASKQAMQNLTAQWYNALTTQLHLDPQQFQLVQGSVALGATSQLVWSLMDSVPPYSITQYWTPDGYKSFSSQYGAVLPRLKDPSSGAFQVAMSDYYEAWMTHLKKAPPPSGMTITSYFSGWAYSHMAPDQAATCVSLFDGAMNGPIAQANSAWTTAGGATGVKAYNQTHDGLQNTIATGESRTVNLASDTESTDTSHTWANGNVEGFWEDFFGGGGSSYDASTSVVTNADVAMEISFTHYATIPIIPQQQGKIVSGLTTYQPWYVPSALSEAYENHNFDIWLPGTPDWSSFFSEDGSLQRAATSLIVVDGITVGMTSKTSVAKSEQESVTSSFAAGFFPFFGVEGQGGWESKQTFNDNGQIIATASCPVGSPHVLGILQTPVSRLVGGVAADDATIDAGDPVTVPLGRNG
jgi:hypothetical protein